VPPCQADSGQQHRREHDDQQRPEIVDEIRFDRRCAPQGEKQQQVKTEQAIDAEQQRRGTDPPLAPRRRRKHTGSAQRKPKQEKRWHVRQAHGEQGEQAPQRDGAKGENGGRHDRRRAGHGGITTT
jgi:hypothetical protein